MNEFMEDMLISMAVDEHLKEQDEIIRKDIKNVDDIFKEKAQNNKAFEKILKKEFKKNKKVVRNPVFYKVATAVAVLLLVFDVCVITVPAVRSATVGFINKVVRLYTDIFKDTEEEDMAESETLEQYNFGFDEEYQATYTPDNMILEQRLVTPIEIDYNYSGPDDSYILVVQGKDNMAANIDSENGTISNIYIGEYDAMLVEKDKKIIIIFSVGNYTIEIDSEGVKKEEIIKMAESIKAVK